MIEAKDMPPGSTTEGESVARGFTLLEALIAVSILAMVGALTYGTFGNAMAARDRAGEITSHYHQIRQAMLRMSNEISMAFLSAHKNRDEPRSDTLFVGKRSAGGMRLDFTSFSHFRIRADAKESDQNALSYYVDRNPEDTSRSALMRREKIRIDEEPDEGGTVQVLAEDVTEVRFEFYDPKEDRWEDDWDSKSSSQKYRLPMYVAIHLTARGLKGEDEKFTTKTRVFLKQRIFILGTGFIPWTE